MALPLRVALGLPDTVPETVEERHCVTVAVPEKESLGEAEGLGLPLAVRHREGEPLLVGEALGQRLPLGEGEIDPEPLAERQ